MWEEPGAPRNKPAQTEPGYNSGYWNCETAALPSVPPRKETVKN